MKAIVPFSFELGKSKSDATAEEHDEAEQIHQGSMKNSVSSLFIDIPIACKDDKSRLQACAKGLQAHKIGPHVFISSLGVWFISHCLPKSWAAYIFTSYARKCTVRTPRSQATIPKLLFDFVLPNSNQSPLPSCSLSSPATGHSLQRAWANRAIAVCKREPSFCVWDATCCRGHRHLHCHTVVQSENVFGSICGRQGPAATNTRRKF
jgi:hypothetical protein